MLDGDNEGCDDDSDGDDDYDTKDVRTAMVMMIMTRKTCVWR